MNAAAPRVIRARRKLFLLNMQATPEIRKKESTAGKLQVLLSHSTHSAERRTPAAARVYQTPSESVTAAQTFQAMW